MIPLAAKATTECRITPSDLWQTTTRFDAIVCQNICPHLHLSKVTSQFRRSTDVYVIADSICHSAWPACDKEEGDWLWIIVRANPGCEHTAAVTYSVKSVQPHLLKLCPDSLNVHEPKEELESESPIYVFPFYAKKPRSFSDYARIRLVRHPRDEFHRTPVEVCAHISLVGSPELPRVHLTTIGVAIPQIIERIAHLEDTLTVECATFKDLTSRFPKHRRTQSQHFEIRYAWVNICHHEVELGELLGKVVEPTDVPATDAETLVNELAEGFSGFDAFPAKNWPKEMMETLHEIQKTLREPGKVAQAKLRISLPIVPLLASYMLELDTEPAIMQTWHKMKALFRKTIHV